MNGNRMYEWLTKIGYTRIGGSDEEKRAALTIQKEIETMNGSATIVPFPVNTYRIEEVALIAENDKGETMTLEVSGYGWSKEECHEKATFYYLEGIDEVSKKQIKGKIVLVNGYLGYDLYKELIEHGAVGFITYSGEVRDSREITDLDQRELRSQLGELGIIPGVHLRAVDAMELVRFQPKEVTIHLKQEKTKGNSQNVIAEIRGTEEPNEKIAFTAHYDSVLFSTGVYDNGAGSVIQLELYRYFLEHRPKRTLVFIWCGSEERGLLGSKAYVASLPEEVKKQFVLCINTDVAGPVLGRDSVNVIGEMSLVHMVEYLAKEINFSVKVSQNIYSSDCMPFADCGIPAVNFMRFGFPGTAYIHNRYDQLFFMSKESLENTANFVKEFSVRIINAGTFPVPRVIPTNMVDAVNQYLKKDTKK